MLGKIARIILAFACFPWLGASSLCWVGGYVSSMLAMAKLQTGLPLDYLGSILGALLGLLLAIQIIGCSLQPETSPVRPVADNILIIVALSLLVDLLSPRVLGRSPVVGWLPAVSLAVWAGCGAATMSLAGMRKEMRMQPPRPVAPPPQGW